MHSLIFVGSWDDLHMDMGKGEKLERCVIDIKMSLGTNALAPVHTVEANVIILYSLIKCIERRRSYAV